MKTMKKIMSVVMVTTLITSQIGCAGKVTKISEPIDQVKFDKEYTYTVKLKNGKISPKIPGDELQGENNQLNLKSKNEKRFLMAQDILEIDGVNNKSNGTNALMGLRNGSIFGFLGGVIVGMFISGIDPQPNLIEGGIGAVFCGLVGLSIGAATPKHSHIQITPIVEPTKTGSINAGANLGVMF